MEFLRQPPTPAALYSQPPPSPGRCTLTAEDSVQLLASPRVQKVLNSLSPRIKLDIPKKEGGHLPAKDMLWKLSPKFRRVQEPLKKHHHRGEKGTRLHGVQAPELSPVDGALSQCQMRGSFATLTCNLNTVILPVHRPDPELQAGEPSVWSGCLPHKHP